jgi:hypothetical protein
MLYGTLVRHLHDDHQLAPFQVEGLLKPSHDWRYLLFWGVAGVALGSLLPWFDTLWEEEETAAEKEKEGSPKIEEGGGLETGLFGADWTPVIRSIGAFAGVAFAIVRPPHIHIQDQSILTFPSQKQRKLPWTSTLQASLTLALVNPVLWYIIDRSKPGFILSTAVGATGTALLLASNADMMPSPGAFPNSTIKIKHHSLTALPASYVSRESVEGGIWIASVLFCSCVCFGNIGRRLALSGRGTSFEKTNRKRESAVGEKH